MARSRVYIALTGILVLCAVEVFGFLILWGLSGGAQRHSFWVSERKIIRFETGGPKIAGQLEVMHPYLGFIMDHGQSRDLPFSRTNGQPYINELGFLGHELPPKVKNANEFVVGIVGGSVASWLKYDAGDVLKVKLEKSSLLAGRSLKLVNLAMGGYKQPQQLLTVAYLLGLGYQFDLILNIDGFNEVALSWVEMKPKGIFPHFPREWDKWVEPAQFFNRNPGALNAAIFQKLRVSWARWMDGSVCDLSFSCLAVWKSVDRILQGRIWTEMQKDDEPSPPSTSYAFRGPPFPSANRTDFEKEMAENWKRSSLQLARLCQANGIAYVHVLQPNQYVPNTKVLTEEEKKKAFRDDQPYRIAVLEGYPFLRQKGEELLREDVAFLDLTEVFSKVKETLYVDDCCHFNEAGNHILAREIAAFILKSRSLAHVSAIGASKRRR